MPTYTVTSPDGRKVKLTGDSPPTEQELEDIFSKLPAAEGVAPRNPAAEASLGITPLEIKAGDAEAPAGPKGFLKSLTDSPLMKGAAQPQSIGDFLSLLIPSSAGTTEMGSAAIRTASAMKQGAQESKPGILNTLSGMITGAKGKIDNMRRADRGVFDYLPNKSGYTGVESAGNNELHEAISGLGKSSNPNPSNNLQEILSSGLAEEKAPRVTITPKPGPGAEPRITAIKSSKLSPQDWVDLRRYYGTEELSKLTGVPVEAIKKLAPGPSRLPLQAEDLMNQRRSYPE